MRIFKDIRLVEQLGSGIPRILDFYSKDCFKFTDHFIRMKFMSTLKSEVTTPHVTPMLPLMLPPMLPPMYKSFFKY